MEQFNWTDWFIIIVIGISCLFGLKRGFVKEAFSLASWITAFFISRLFASHLSDLLMPWIDTPILRLASAFSLLFVGTLIVGALISNLLVQLVRTTGLSGTDRLFGMVFGIIRGALVIVVLMSLLSMTPISNESWWQESLLTPHFVLIEEWSYKVADDVSGLLNQL